ncbi:MAG TPA: BatA domain-containing protein [Tepidisphaeraceae bacterium]|nr:BatA domain-containing protein [Tepidisphaeraceae bacterium]
MTIASLILAAWFVNPWFVAAGAALASIPIIIHILNRRRFRVVRWAAMEYLLQAMRKNRRKLKFEHWLLLAIRCLLIFLMALALARPMGCENATVAALGGRQSALHVIVVDNSYSMAYEPGGRADAKTHLDQAKLTAKKLVDTMASGNEAVMIITASAPVDRDRPTDPHAVTPRPTYDLQQARAAIDRIEQTYAGTDMNGAFQLALRVAEEEKGLARKHLHVFTDGTKSAFEAPQVAQALKEVGPRLSAAFGKFPVHALGKPGQWNQAVLGINSASNLVTTNYSATFNAQLEGYGTGPEPVLQWKVNNVPEGLARRIKLDAESRPTVTPPNGMKTGGPQVVSVSLTGEDRLPIDNVRNRVVDVVSEMRVLIVEGERGVGALQGSGSFLELALSPPDEGDADGRTSNKKTKSYIAPEPPVGEIELASKKLENYRAVLLTNVGQVSARQADQLRRFVDAGGGLIIFAGPGVNADSYNEHLGKAGLLPGQLIKTRTSNDAAYHFAFDYTGNPHPFVREFKNQEKSGLDTAQVWSYWQIELPANSTAERVLEYKETKDPAITVHTLGRGRVIFFSTTANAEWNALPPKPAYVTLMHELLAGSVGAGDRWMNLTVGDYLEVPQALALTAPPELTDGKDTLATQAVTSKEGVTTYRSSKVLAKPGLYTLKTATGNRTFPVVVNPPDNEADVRVIPAESIKKALGDIELTFVEETVSLAGLKADTGNELSWTVMAIVFLLAGIECYLAMRFGHHKRGTAHAPEFAGAQRAAGEQERKVMSIGGRITLMVVLMLMLSMVTITADVGGREWLLPVGYGLIAGGVQWLFGPRKNRGAPAA